MKRKHPAIVLLSCVLSVAGLRAASAGSDPQSPPGAAPALARLARQTLASQPLSFVENRGQLDPVVRFSTRCGATTAFFTAEGFVLRLLGSADPLAHRAANPSGPLLASEPAGRAPAADDDVAGANVFLTFEASRDDVILHGVGRSMAPVRSYRGADPEAWVQQAKSWSALRYEGLYSGVDLMVVERAGELAYDLILAPGAELSRVVVRCDGVDGLALDGEQLLLHTAAGPLLQSPPLAWQLGAEGQRLPVSVSFRLLGQQRYGFVAEGLAQGLPLVIDPGLTWASALGGSAAERITSLVLAQDGDLLVSGTTGSVDFPTTPGAFQSSLVGFSDVFVARIDPLAGQLRFSTFLGGMDAVLFRPEVGEDLAEAADGSIVVAGTASSPDFPTTVGVVQPGSSGGSDAFVARLAADGTLQWSTRIGGSNNDEARALAVAPDGTVILAGHTFSGDLPTTSGAYDESFNSLFLSDDIFVCRLSADGSAMVWCTYVGGTLRDEARALLLAPDGSVIVGGLSGSADFPVTAGAYDLSYNGTSGTETDGVLLGLSPLGDALDFATFLGSAEITEICGVARAVSGDLLVAGTTFGDDFPATPGVRQETFGGGLSDGFLAAFSSDAATLRWSTFFGGQGDETIHSLALDGRDQPTVVGSSTSPQLFHDLPPELSPVRGPGALAAGSQISGPAAPPSAGGPSSAGAPGPGSDLTLDGPSDAWLARLSADGGSLVWGSYYGGSLTETATALKLDAMGNAWLAGSGDSPDLPTTPGAVDTTPNGSFDGFLAHFAVPPLSQWDLVTPSAPGAAPPRLVLSGSFRPGRPWWLLLEGCPPGAVVALVLAPAAVGASNPGSRPGLDDGALVLPLIADGAGRCQLDGLRWPASRTRRALAAWVAGPPARSSNAVLLVGP